MKRESVVFQFEEVTELTKDAGTNAYCFDRLDGKDRSHGCGKFEKMEG